MIEVVIVLGVGLTCYFVGYNIGYKNRSDEYRATLSSMTNEQLKYHASSFYHGSVGSLPVEVWDEMRNRSIHISNK